jgi:hypothetical protein
MPTSLKSRSKCLSVSRSSAIAPDSSRGKNSDPKKSSSALNAAITSHAIGKSISSDTGNITRCGHNRPAFLAFRFAITPSPAG